MTQIFAKCPKCGTETKAKRSTRWRMCSEGDCDSCGVHFTTAAFWQTKIAHHYKGSTLFFGHKNRHQTELQVDLGDLQNEKEHLSSFLQSNLKVSVAPVRNKLVVNSEKLSAQELQRAVTKFVYHQNFNNTHWVSIEGTTVKINRFKGTTKKKEKPKENTPHQTAMQSWGL